MNQRHWVIVRDVPMTIEEMKKEFGPPCTDYGLADEGCCVCAGWKQWLATGTVNLLIDRATLLAHQ